MQNVKDDLEKIYSDVSEWLKFAEAKHAAALALWTALVVGALSSDKFYELAAAWQNCILSLLLIGMAINIVALTPFVNRVEWLKKDCYNKYKTHSDNLIFYQSIFVSVYTPNSTTDTRVDKYKDILKQEYNQPITGKLTTDYIKQIVDAATVATIKTYLFSVTSWYLAMILILTFLYIYIF